jgi:hypothetical protein
MDNPIIPESAIHPMDVMLTPSNACGENNSMMATIIHNAVEAMIKRQKFEYYGPIERTALEKKNGASVQQHEAKIASNAPEWKIELVMSE